MEHSHSIKPNTPHTDIRSGGWIEQKLPPHARPFAYLMRLDRPIGTWLLLLPGWWAILAAAGGVSGLGVWGWYVLFLFGLGAIIMRGAGCAINDLWDRKIDRQVERTKSRPLAAGDITPLQAILLILVLLWMGLLILVQLPTSAILVGVASLGLIGIYPLAKRVMQCPQLVLGFTFNVGALMGWASLRGEINTPAVLLYGAGICWTLGYDTIYAHQDKQDDALIGIKSTALWFAQRSPLFISGFYGAATLMIYFSGWLTNQGPLFYGLWAIATFHLIRQVSRWDLDNPASCLAVFRSNRDFGLLILLAFASGTLFS